MSLTPLSDFIRHKLETEHSKYRELRRRIVSHKISDKQVQSQASITLEKTDKSLSYLNRAGKCTKLALLTLGSFSTALLFEDIRDGWREVYTGREVKHVVIPLPTSQEAKVQDLLFKEDTSLDFHNHKISFDSFRLLIGGASGFQSPTSAEPLKEGIDIMRHFLPKVKGKFEAADQVAIDECLKDFKEGQDLHQWVSKASQTIEKASLTDKPKLQQRSAQGFKDYVLKKLKDQKGLYMPLTWQVYGKEELKNASVSHFGALCKNAMNTINNVTRGTENLFSLVSQFYSLHALDPMYQNLPMRDTARSQASITSIPLAPRISVELFLEEKGGKSFVRGRVINLGVGIKEHLHFKTSNTLEKLKVAPIIDLPEIPLEDLDKGCFFELLFQIQLPKEAFVESEDGKTVVEKTTYMNPQDFYRSVLGAWSQTQKPIPNKDVARVAQRDEHGALKLFWNNLYEKLGNEKGKLAKFYVTFAALKLCLAQGQLSDENRSEFSFALEKVTRRAIKLFSADLLTSDEVDEVNKFHDEWKVQLGIEEKKLKALEKSFSTSLKDPIADRNWYFGSFLPLFCNLPKGKSSAPPAMKVSSIKEVGIERFIANHADLLRKRSHLEMNEEQKQLATYTLSQLPEPSSTDWESITDSMNVLSDLRTIQEILAENITSKDNQLLITPQQACLWLKLSVITLRFSKNALRKEIFEAFALRLYLHARDGMSMFFAPLNANNAFSFHSAKDYIYTLLMEHRPEDASGKKDTEFELFGKAIDINEGGFPKNQGKKRSEAEYFHKWFDDKKQQAFTSIDYDTSLHLPTVSPLEKDPELAFLLDLHEKRRSLWHIFVHADFQSGIDRLFEKFYSRYISKETAEYAKVSTEYARRSQDSKLLDSEYGMQMHAYQLLRDTCNYMYLATDVNGTIPNLESKFPWNLISKFQPRLSISNLRNSELARKLMSREKSANLSYSLFRIRGIDLFLKGTQFSGVKQRYENNEGEGELDDAYNYAALAPAFPEFGSPQETSRYGSSRPLEEQVPQKLQTSFEEFTQLFISGHLDSYLRRREAFERKREGFSEKSSTEDLNTFEIYHQNHLSQIVDPLNLRMAKDPNTGRFSVHPFTPLELQDLFSIHIANALQLSQIEHFFHRVPQHMYKGYHQSLFYCLLFRPDGDGKTPLMRSLENGEEDREVESFLTFIEQNLKTAQSKNFNESYLFYLRLCAVTLNHVYIHAKSCRDKYKHYFENLQKNIQLLQKRERLEKVTSRNGLLLDTVLLSILHHFSELPSEIRDPFIKAIHVIRQDIDLKDTTQHSDPHLQEDRSRAEFLIENVEAFKVPTRSTDEFEILPQKYRTKDFKSLFGELSPYCKKIQPGYYEFNEGIDTYRIRNDSLWGVTIYRLMEDENGESGWYCFYNHLNITRSEKSFSIRDFFYGPQHQSQEALIDPKGPLYENTEFWMQTGGKRKVLVCDSSNRSLKKDLNSKLKDELRKERSYGISSSDRKNIEREIADLSRKKISIRCVVTPQHIIHPEDANLVLAYNFSHPILKTIGRLDPSRPLWVWKHKKTNEIERIEHDRLDCSFYAVKDDRGQVQWKSASIYGYYLDDCQKNPFFHPFPCVTLVNDNGDRKVFLPTHAENEQEISGITKSIVYLSHKLIQLGLNKGSIDYWFDLFGIKVSQTLTNSSMLFTYEFNNRGELLFPSSRRDLMFYIYLMFKKGDVKEAYKALAKVKRIPDLGGTEEQEILNLLSSLIPKPPKDDGILKLDPDAVIKLLMNYKKEEFNTTLANSSPQQIAFLLQLYHYLRNHPTYSNLVRSSDAVKALLAFYVNKLNNIPTSLRLSDTEFNNICRDVRYLLNTQEKFCQPDNPSLASTSGGDETSDVIQRLHKSSLFLSPSAVAAIEKKMFEHRENPIPLKPSLRQGEAFLYNFLYYIDVLDSLFKVKSGKRGVSKEEMRKLEGEKVKLQALLSACQEDQESLVKSCAHFLQNYIHRIDSPHAPVRTQKENSFPYFSDTLDFYETRIESIDMRHQVLENFLKNLKSAAAISLKECKKYLKEFNKKNSCFEFTTRKDSVLQLDEEGKPQYNRNGNPLWRYEYVEYLTEVNIDVFFPFAKKPEELSGHLEKKPSLRELQKAFFGIFGDYKNDNDSTNLITQLQRFIDKSQYEGVEYSTFIKKFNCYIDDINTICDGDDEEKLKKEKITKYLESIAENLGDFNRFKLCFFPLYDQPNTTEKSLLYQILKNSLEEIYSSEEELCSNKVENLMQNFAKYTSMLKNSSISACTYALHHFYHDQLKTFCSQRKVLESYQPRSNPLMPPENDYDKQSSCPKVQEDMRLQARCQPEEKKDTLLQELQGVGLVHLSSPSETEVQLLKRELQNIEELQHTYHTKVVDYKRQQEGAIAREYQRLLDGVIEKRDNLENQILGMEGFMSSSRGVPDEAFISYGIDESKIEDTLESLEKDLFQRKKEVEEAEESVMSALKPLKRENLLKLNGELLPTLNLSEALIYYGRGDDAPFYRANPEFTPDSLKAFKQETSQYLMQMLNLQKKQRFFKQLKKLQDIKTRKNQAKNPSSQQALQAEYEVLKSKCIEILKQRRHYLEGYAPHEMRTFMVFERFADICLREEQLQALESIRRNKNVILEARTGFGKSKALIPLWLYLVSSEGDFPDVKDGTRKIAMMTVTKALYTQQDQYLKKIMGGAFDKMIFSFEFTRDMGKKFNMTDEDYLNWLKNSLIKSKNEGLIVLTTIGSLHSLMNLKIKECVYNLVKAANSGDYNSFDNISRIIRLLGDIRRLVQSDALNFIDESRECLDIRCYYDYSAGGQKQQIPMSRALHFEDTYLKVFEMAKESGTNGFNLDFLPDASEDHQAITEEYFKEEIKSGLAEKLWETLQELGITEDAFTPKEFCVVKKHFLGHSLSPENMGVVRECKKGVVHGRSVYAETFGEMLEAKLLNYIAGKEGSMTPNFRDRAKLGPIGASSTEGKNNVVIKVEKALSYYAAFRNQLNTFLPRTLTRPCNGRYGLVLSQGHRYAFPFDKGVPKLSSEFATIDDYLNFTVQANLKEAIELDLIREFISKLKALSNPDSSLDTSEEYRKNQQMDCFKLFIPHMKCKTAITKVTECSEEHLKEIYQILNDPNHIDLKLRFICRVILPKIRISLKKLTNNVHNLISGMGITYGASGTVNDDTLPLKLTTQSDPATPIGSIISMWRDSRNEIKELPEFIKDSYTGKTRVAVAKDLLLDTLEKDSSYRVIVDVNGTFRDLRNPKIIAGIVFEKTKNWEPPINAFSFYDDAGENLIYQRPKKGEPLGAAINRDLYNKSEENIFVFMRQSAVIGADTPMTATAKAWVTVGKDTVRDLFLQGVGRMRGILTGQKVAFLIHKPDVPFFQSRLIVDIALKVFEDNPDIKAFRFYDDKGSRMLYLRPEEGELIQPPIDSDSPIHFHENEIFDFMFKDCEISPSPEWQHTGGYYIRTLSFKDGESIKACLKAGKIAFYSSGKELSLKDILALVSATQGKQKGEDMFFNLSIVLQSLFEKHFWNLFDHTNFVGNLHLRSQGIKKLEKYLYFMLEETKIDPMTTIDITSENLTLDRAVHLLTERFRKRADFLEPGEFNGIMKEFYAYYNEHKSKLPHEIRTSTSDGDRETEIEQSIEVEAEEENTTTATRDKENEKNQESEKECRTALDTTPFTPSNAIQPGHYSELSPMAENPSNKVFPAGSYFPDKQLPNVFKNVWMTQNFYHMQAAAEGPAGPAPCKLKQSYHYLVIKDASSNYRLVLLDIADSGAFKEQMLKDSLKSDHQYYLLNSNGRVICQNASDELSFEMMNQVMPLFSILRKVLSRYFILDSQELNFLKMLYRLSEYHNEYHNENHFLVNPSIESLKTFIDQLPSDKSSYIEKVKSLVNALEDPSSGRYSADREELRHLSEEAFKQFAEFTELLEEVGKRWQEESSVNELLNSCYLS